MGVDYNSLRFLLFCKTKLAVDFEQTITLGHQHLVIKQCAANRLFQAFGYAGALPEDPQTPYADAVFNLLGAKDLQSVDNSRYQNASIITDLNDQIPGYLKEKFTCVVDGGTLEHIYDFPTALDNALDMVKPGGHFLSIGVANNFLGHGFYQFSPDLMFRALERRNFEDTQVFLCPVHGVKWYRVEDPSVTGRRTVCTIRGETYILTVGRRAHRDTALGSGYQSDYAKRWSDAASSSVDQAPSLAGSGVALRYWNCLPRVVRQKIKFVAFHLGVVKTGLTKFVPERATPISRVSERV